MPQLPSGNFNPNDHGDMRDFTPVPPGKYIVRIINSEVKDTSTGGMMLVLFFDILAGPYTGKGFVSRLNLQNAKPRAVKIANEELATITRACKLGPIQTSEQLHNIALLATLNLIPGDGQYGPKNEPTFYTTTDGYDRENIPVNPEPDEITQQIIAGIKTAGDAGDATTGGAQPETKTPSAPAGFGSPDPDPKPAPTPEQTQAAPAPPAGFGEQSAPAAPETTPAAPAADTAAPPW